MGWRFQDQEVHTQEQIWGSGKLLSNSQIFICIIKGHISNANNLLSWFLTWNDQAGPKQNCNSMIHAAKRKVIISWVLPYYLVIIFSGMTMSGSRSFFDMDTGWRRKKAWLTHWRKSNFSRYMVIFSTAPLPFKVLYIKVNIDLLTPRNLQKSYFRYIEVDSLGFPCFNLLFFGVCVWAGRGGGN